MSKKREFALTPLDSELREDGPHILMSAKGGESFWIPLEALALMMGVPASSAEQSAEMYRHIFESKQKRDSITISLTSL